MAIEITVEEVKAIAPDTGATDAAIQMQINIVGCKIDACLEANYGDCPDLAKAIKIYTVAYFAAKGSSPQGATTSRKWSDGSAEGYSDTGMTAAQKYWDMAIQLDSAGCVSNAFPTNKVFVVTGSNVTRSGCAK